MANTIDPNDIIQGGEALNDFNDKLDKSLDIAGKFHQVLLDQVKAIKAAREETKNVYDLQDQLNKLRAEKYDIIKKERSLEQNATAEAKKAIDIIKEGFKARRDQGEELTKLASIQAQVNAAEISANANTAQGQQLIADLRQKAKDQQDKIVKLNEKENALSDILLGNYKKQNIQLSDSEKNTVQQYLHQQKLGEELEEYLKNHNIDLKTQQQIIDAQKAQMSNWQLLNQRIENTLGKVKSIKLVSDTWEWGKKQFDALGLSFGVFLKNLLDFDKILTDSAKSLGISVEGVRQLTKGYDNVSMSAESYNKSANAATMSVKAQLEAQNELNTSLGTSNLITAKARVDQVVLTKQMGLQADEAAKLYQLGLLNKQSAEDVTRTTTQQVINLTKESGIQLNLKKVLQDVAKVSGQLAAQYKNNPELLAHAVVQAKALGLELQQTAGMADKLLNFESSIESELKAELLLGKQLNFEQARYLALMGNTAGAAKEIMFQIGNLSDFQKLNVIQQKSLAEAAGLTADELANAFKQQELLKGSAFSSQQAFEEAARNAKTSEERAALEAQIKQSSNADILMQQYQQISNQERFNAVIDKLKESLILIVEGPFGKMLDSFSKMVSSASALKAIMFGIGTIVTGNMIKGIISFVGQIMAARAAAAGTAAAALATSSALTMGIGIVAVLGALAAGIYALNQATGENISVSSATGGASVNATPQTYGMNGGFMNGGGQGPSQPIVLHNYNTTYVGPNKMSDFSTTQQMNSQTKFDTV